MPVRSSLKVYVYIVTMHTSHLHIFFSNYWWCITCTNLWVVVLCLSYYICNLYMYNITYEHSIKFKRIKNIWTQPNGLNISAFSSFNFFMRKIVLKYALFWINVSDIIQYSPFRPFNYKTLQELVPGSLRVMTLPLQLFIGTNWFLVALPLRNHPTPSWLLCRAKFMPNKKWPLGVKYRRLDRFT